MVYASDKEILKDKGNTTKGYWSESNPPEFYGTTKIVLKQGDTFSLKDARYRIFARDFEDFDLSQSIKAKHNVDTSNTGNYKINYSVTDSHGNTTTIDVPVTVTNDQNIKPMIERTMYTLADIDNVKAMGIERGHNHDRQMLGLFIKANSNIEIRKTAGNSDLSYTMLNNDKLTESSKTITNEWQTVTFEHDYTPFIKTLYKHPDPVKVEIQWDSNDEGVKELNYYREGDDEKAFFEKWKADTGAYGVVESYILTVLVPYTDINEIVGHWAKGFKTLDDFFDYFRKVVEAYDKTLGLDYAPDHPYDQNVNARVFAKANAHGAGAAYYAGDHIGVNKPKVSSFFEANWGGLHEFGHGYQGSLGKGDLQIGEVSNNIFGHYVQINRDIFPYDADWLGKLPNIEEKHNKVRLDGGTFLDLDIPGRLYFIINFLNAFEGPDTYAHIAKLYRKNVIEGKEMSTQDAWALGIYDKYGVSLVDYFDAWGIKVSEEARFTIEQGNSKNAFSLKDLVVDQTLTNQIKSDLGFDCNYQIVTNEQLSKYNLKGSSKINIQIDNIDLLKGKYILLKDGNKTVSKVKIDSNIVEIPDAPIGVYKLVVPELLGSYTNNSNSMIIYNNKKTEFNLVYEKSNAVNTFENDVKVQFQGRYKDDAAEVKLVNDNGNLKLNLRYRGTSLLNSGTSQDGEYAKIQILDNNNTEVYKKVVGGNGEMFSSQNLEIFEVPVNIGYKLILKYWNSDTKLKFISNLNGDYRSVYEIPKNKEGTFIVTEKGLKPTSLSDEEFYTEYTSRMKTYMDNFIQQATDNEIYNKNFYKDVKSIIVRGYEQMNEDDKLLYQDLYNKIVKGHVPVITSLSDNVEIKINGNIDLTKLIEVNDVEDGKIDFPDIKIETNLDTTRLGTYTAKYTVEDSENNISTKTITIQVVKHQYDSLKLEDLIDKISKLDKTEYESQSFNNLQNALIVANNVLIRDDLTQDMVDEQIDILQECLNNLKKVYKVTFNSNGGSEVAEIKNVKENSLISEPNSPTKEGYIFEGWYKSEDYSEKWDFVKDLVTKDTTLYAKWTTVSEEPIEPPLDGEEQEEPIEPPLDGEEQEEPIESPLEGGDQEKPIEPPLEGGKQEELIELPLNEEKSEEQIEQLLDGEKLIEDNINKEQDNQEMIALGNTDNNEVNDNKPVESIEKNDFNNYKSEIASTTNTNNDKRTKEALSVGVVSIAAVAVLKKLSLTELLKGIILRIFK